MDFLNKKEIVINNAEISKQSNFSVKTRTKSQVCYFCKKKIHTDADEWFCNKCKTKNIEKREELSPQRLDNYYAIVTGGRIKIGYETCLKLLRSGAVVLTTTRFPIDAALRYSQELDFDIWKNKLKIYKIDFRNIHQLEYLTNYINTNYKYIDILINNAAQTIQRPYSYYEHLKSIENKSLDDLSNSVKALICEESMLFDFFKYQQSIDILMGNDKLLTSDQNKDNSLFFPSNRYNEEGQQLDLRSKNSWTSKVEDVQVVELLEVQLVNVTTPFMLCSELKRIMERSPNKERFIINVSAMEGCFSKQNKNSFHPHTNMAKASLNMLTRTAAQDYAKSNIYMNSVDTGWITDENPEHIKLRNRKKKLVPPLSIKDGAARICDPIFSSLKTKEFAYGNFYKNFSKINW